MVEKTEVSRGIPTPVSRGDARPAKVVFDAHTGTGILKRKRIYIFTSVPDT